MEILAGRYELVREIGRGATATVFLAHDRLLDRDVAVKLIAPALANDASFVDRFMREARLAAGLRHPNIVTVFDVGEADDDRPFLAMDLVDGVSLEQVIETHGPVPLAETVRILTELANAVEYLHSRGLIHRDVKPSNVLIEESGRVLLSDFGIAYAREAARYTMTGIVLGTPRYMAPEQMVGEEPVPQTDVYAMGVLAFEMLAGVPPFAGSGTGLMYKVVHEPAPALDSLARDIPPGVSAVIARALRKDPAERWEGPGEFAAAFASPEANLTLLGGGAPSHGEAGQAGTDTTPAQLTSDPEPGAADDSPGGSGGRRRWSLAGMGLAGIAGLAVASYCLAAGGGAGTPSSEAGGAPSPSPSASTAGPPTSTPSPSGTASAANGSPTPTASGIGIVATPRPTTRATPTSPPPGTTPTSTGTPSPVPTTAATPSPTSTTTATPSPTSTATAPPTATPTPSPTQAPPNAPSNVALNGDTLSWNDNSNNESGFRIYWRSSTLASGATQIHNDKSVGPNTTTTPVNTIFLTADQTDFRRGVSAYNAAGESAIAWNP